MALFALFLDEENPSRSELVGPFATSEELSEFEDQLEELNRRDPYHAVGTRYLLIDGDRCDRSPQECLEAWTDMVEDSLAELEGEA